MGNMIKKMKSRIVKSGGAMGKMFYVKQDTKRRFRFMSDMEDPIEILFHDSYEDGINTPCLEIYGKECPHCGNDDLRSRFLYGWPVYDYEDKEIKILLWAANNFSPLPQALDYFEEFGSIQDRDYILKRNGSGLNTNYTLMPKSESKFKEKVDVPSEEEILKLVASAHGVVLDEDSMKEAIEDDDIEDDFEVEEDWAAVEEKPFKEILADQERKNLWKVGQLCKTKLSKKWNAEKMAAKLLEDNKETKIKKAFKHIGIELEDDIPF